MARPIEFDKSAVLQKAAGAFWEHGYCATSVADLVASTGLKPGSLYAAFDSKEGLLLAALDHYGERGVARARDCIEQAATPLAGVQTFFDRLVADSAGAAGRRGCFLVNMSLEVAPHNTAVRKRVRHHMDAVEAVFADALQRAQREGELAADQDPVALAHFLMVGIWGIRVAQRLRTDPARIAASAAQCLAVLRTRT